MKPDPSVLTDVKVRAPDVLHDLSFDFRFPDVSLVVPLKIFVMLAALLLGSTGLHATTVIALSNGQQVVMAADSRLTVTKGGADTYYQVCKVVVRSRAAYALSGIVGPPGDDIVQPQGLRAIDLYGANDLVSSMSGIRAEIRRTLDGLVPTLSPREIQKHQSGVSITDLFGIGMNPGPWIMGVSYFLRFGMTVHEVERNNTLAAFPMRPGVSDARPANWRDLSDLVPVVKKMMEVGIAADPESAYPITIVRLTKDGTEWVERGACEEGQ